MPIYAYRCESCGFDKDVLQKMSDAPLTQCPSCGADAFRKQVTAAGFQLKGSGWYVTDFRGDGKKGGSKPSESDTDSIRPVQPRCRLTLSDTGPGNARRAVKSLAGRCPERPG